MRRARHRGGTLVPAGALLAGLIPLVAANSGCGRLGLVTERSRRGHAASPDGSPDAFAAPDGSAVVPLPDAALADAGLDGAKSHDAAPLDATVDAVDAMPERDATLADVRTAPDCTCPPDDYYVDANVNGVAIHLDQALPLGLYCNETEPELSHQPCTSVNRLTACAEPSGKPPCLYIAVDGQEPLVGFYIDSTGQTFDLITGKIPEPTTSGRMAIGTFSAIYAGRTSESTVTVTGTFHACATLFGPCGR